MKKIAILFAAVVALSSCGGGAEKCEGNCPDSTTVVAPVVDTTVVKADTTKVDTTSVVTTTVK
jgi:hypothetical protein